MKFAVLLIVLVAVAVASALPAKGSTKAGIKKKTCVQDCNDEEYKPLCANDDSKEKPKSFGSECALKNYNCESGKELKVVSQGECPGGGAVRLS